MNDVLGKEQLDSNRMNRICLDSFNISYSQPPALGGIRCDHTCKIAILGRSFFG